ncbi:MAG: IS30 family transposase [Acidimicrobiales bacterium]
MSTWRAGCGESRTSGSEGGPEKPTHRQDGQGAPARPLHHRRQQPVRARRPGRTDEPLHPARRAPLGYRANDLLTALQARLRSIVPDLRRTLTWDQGSEMAAWPDLERLTGLDCYFCQPHSPWQKGTVENTNRILRRHLPRGLDLARVPTSHLRHIETNLNTMPRRLHQWRTAHDLLSPHLFATAA